ncbi:putative Ig domain-containing protein [Mycobacterium sp. BK086]|uniref:putative Ig domain-containing protein n=1 Tax=Mycobacterium sp. BK086 TaxID=2512165 RepID=UPI00105BF118|nr:putative Ig domain-containing protein [Mycobacterium sp. BK086]TDO18118.1 putative Ig domain-containing protein [Mycobacterium sp. BK086]
MAGPFDQLITALNSDQSATIQVVGDSTAYGSYYPPNAALSQYSWAGPLAVLLGDLYDMNVQVYLWNYPTNNGYRAAVSLRTATRGRAPTITVMLGGIPSQVMATYNSYKANLLPVSNPKLVIIWDGFNEISTGTFTAQYLLFIDAVKTRCPGAPILATTQHTPFITYESFLPGHTVLFVDLFNALITTLVPGEDLSLTPPIQQSTTQDGVWMIDSRQINLVTADFYTDLLHPIASGYAKIAAWLFSAITVGFGGAPDISTTALNDLTVGEAFSQTLAVTGTTPITWEVQSGQLPVGVDLDEDTGVITGTPTTAGSYTATVRASNLYGHDDQVFTGSVHAVVRDPFDPNSVGRAVVQLNGSFYPVAAKVFDGDLWKPAIARD